MAVVKTEVVNGKTIRTWEESRGNKTLTRKFYVQYRLIMIKGNHLDSNVYDTLSTARKESCKWMVSFGVKWGRYDEACTHIEGTQWRCRDNGKNAKCYICEEGGDRISEVIE